MTTVLRTLLRCIFAGSCALAASAATLANPPLYRVQAIPGFEVIDSDEAINNRGEIAGVVGTDEGPRAAIYSRGVVTQLGALGGQGSNGFGINDRGDVVGSSNIAPGDLTVHAFLFSDGVMEDLGALRQFSLASAVNNRRIVIGSENDTSELPQDLFIYRNGAKRVIPSAASGAINERGQIAGSDIDPETNVNTAFIFHRGRKRYLGTLEGDDSASPGAINERGQTIGSSISAAGVIRWFFHDGRRMRELPTPAPIFVVVGLNNRGDITGTEREDGANQNVTGYLYRDGIWHNLNSLLSPRDPLTPFVTITRAAGLNDRGQIVAGGRDSRTNNIGTYLLTPVPRKHRR
jgi:probable HAF family extracellular repeat protein